MTRDQLDDAAGYSLLAEAVADAKNADTEASPGQVRAFYDRHRDDLYTTVASYRLGKITVPGEKLAEELVRRLRRGASFPALARRYSMDQQTRYQGGDLGWVSAFTVPREVLAVVEGVAPGGVAEPVWSSGKWQVFQVVARRPARVVPFAEARDAIARELTRRRRATCAGPLDRPRSSSAPKWSRRPETSRALSRTRGPSSSPAPGCVRPGLDVASHRGSPPGATRGLLYSSVTETTGGPSCGTFSSFSRRRSAHPRGGRAQQRGRLRRRLRRRHRQRGVALSGSPPWSRPSSFVVGLAAAWFARAATYGHGASSRRSSRPRTSGCREAEALAARPAPAPEPTPSSRPPSRLPRRRPPPRAVVAAPVTVAATRGTVNRRRGRSGATAASTSTTRNDDRRRRSGHGTTRATPMSRGRGEPRRRRHRRSR